MNTKTEQVNELLLQALETEIGGAQVYETALRCTTNEDLRKEWNKYLDQTRHHEQILLDVFKKLEMDPEAESPGRAIVRHIGESLVKAMEMALKAGSPQAAELVAGECVVAAETRDHLNWNLIGMVAKKAKGTTAKTLKAAHDEVEDEEDEHLYHSTGWTRDLWLGYLGLPAVLLPPEVVMKVETAVDAARAKQARSHML